MNKMEKIFDRINPMMTRIANNPTLKGISSGMMASLPVTIIGSLCLLLAVFPVKAVTDFLSSIGLTGILLTINTVTIGCLALYIVAMLTNSLIKSYDPNSDDGITAAIIALMCFLIVTPMGATVDKVTAIPTTWLGSAGVFSSIIISIVTAKMFLFIRRHGWTIKMPASVPPMVSRVFEGLVPGILIAIVFIIVNYIFVNTNFGCMHQAVYAIVQTPLQHIGGNVGAMIIFTIAAQLLWFFGIHGTNVIAPIYGAIWLPMDLQNQAAVAAGEVAPNIIGKAFFETFTFGGCVLGFVFLMAFFAKSSQYKSLGRLSLVPALFGITEPVIFGTPLVLNFTFFIPFVFGNVIAILIAYFAMALHIVPTMMAATPIFGLPIGFHAAIQGSWQIIVLQIFIMVVLGLVWYPFFKKADNDAYKLEQTTKN